MKTLSDNIFLQENFLNEIECQILIDRSDDIGYEYAKVKLGENTFAELPQVRNNQRVIEMNFDLSEDLFTKSQALLPFKFGLYNLKRLNEMFRFYKYETGQQFKIHQDESFERNKNECSFFTFIIYLNDDFKGGETIFQNGLKVIPSTGDLLVFYHPLPHKGAAIESGVKYVLRTDVMYTL